ncbi:pullulanase 1, chloroplastic-like [Ziziphus jujuba]|uniref:Pullulanase 1, chloroplastic-like n=1 Tax=Ziziphus jujuba TaxID=326968 RepID=A0ABM4AGF0_ZIZJJ|nr:pullulanase 1, chloroplastic-like [Ziziphus jujuba]
MSSQASLSTSEFQDGLLYSIAYWVTESIIAWNVDVGNDCCYLLASQDVKVKLEEDNYGFQQRDYRAFRLPPGLDFRPLLKCHLAVATFCSKHILQLFLYYSFLNNALLKDIERYKVNALLKYVRSSFITTDGKCCKVTGLQLPGVLDELFSYSGPLGALCLSCSLFLWVRSAQEVWACIYIDGSADNPQENIWLEEYNGAWSTKGPEGWESCYYVYELSVYHPSPQKIQKCYANDPYARGLSSDAQQTLFVNRGSDTLKPEGWYKLSDKKTALDSFSDISIYELQIRDFSAHHHTVEPKSRGGYLTFTLQEFADSKTLKKFPSDSPQQALITAIRNDDGFNPVFRGVPKGSYASNPNGSCCIIECRKMVQIVPGYYLRRNTDGFIENSTCMNNTASEHFMVERLIIDDLLYWTVDCKVGGFSSDLVGHIMKRAMLRNSDQFSFV